MIALLAPVCVFLFLKIFGRNEFAVPVMYAEGAIEAAGKCQGQYSTPYQVADSVMRGLGLNGTDSLYVFYAGASTDVGVNRVSVAFKDAPLQLVSLSDTTRVADPVFLRDCILLMPPGMSVVAVDHRNRIRGYYDAGDRDDVDRLIVEIKIILKEY